MSAKAASKKKDEKKAPKGEPIVLAGSLGQAVAVLSAVVAFVGVVMLYRVIFPPVVDEAAVAEATQASQAQVEVASTVEETPAGVEDPWTYSGTFTTGNTELDGQIKAFCDALTTDGLSAQENARNVYNAIVWGGYRDANQMPAGPDWDLAAAREYFSSGNPEAGETGNGDVYDRAAVIAYCLRYFGMSNALAVPILSPYSSESGGALCLVSDLNGYEKVCDPSLLADGWMLDRYMYTITVEDIGQDLSRIEELGLTAQKSQSALQGQNAGVDGYDASGTDGQSYEGDQSGAYDEGATYDESVTYDQAGTYDESATFDETGAGYDSTYDETSYDGSYDYGY